MNRPPKQIQDILDRHEDLLTYERGSKHRHVKVGDDIITVLNYGTKPNPRLTKNTAARLKRELKSRGLWRE